MFVISVFSVMSDQIENIVLLDTSESMFPYYSGAIEYLIEDIIQEQLQSGDSFHLLSFNDFPEYEISRTIRGEVEIRELLNRILLLQPFGQYTDLISAFSYLYEYVDKLPANSIKRLIILTDGIHDPPPGSPYPVSPDNKDDVIKISEKMRRQGWDVTLIQFPQDDLTSSESNIPKSNGDEAEIKNNLFPVIAETLDKEVISFDNENKSINHEVTGAPEIIFPKDLGTVGKSFRVDFTVINHSVDPVLLKLNGIIFGNENLLDSAKSLKLEGGEQGILETLINLPDRWPGGSYNSTIKLEFSDSYRAFPRNGVLSFYFDLNTNASDISKIFNTRLLLYIIIGIIILFALVYILIKAFSSISIDSSRKGKPERRKVKLSKSAVSSGIRNRHIEIEKIREPGQIAIEMVVKNQNRQIGHRNIHLLGKDHPRSVGGAGSEYFLIFIIETGKRIGEIVLENGVINFIPKSMDFFPDFPGNKLVNCLNKPIRVMNNGGIETTIIFKEWISPALKLNRIMHLLDSKGLPDFKY